MKTRSKLRLPIFFLLAAALHAAVVMLPCGRFAAAVPQQRIDVSFVSDDPDLLTMTARGQAEESRKMELPDNLEPDRNQASAQKVQTREAAPTTERQRPAAVTAINDVNHHQPRQPAISGSVAGAATAEQEGTDGSATSVIGEVAPEAVVVAVSGKADSSAVTASATAPAVASMSQAHPRYGYNPPPVYPPIAHRRGWQGTVEYEVEVLRDGQVGDLLLRSSSGYGSLDEAARKAIRQWRFNPATVSGVPIDSWVVVPISFVLESATNY